MNALSQVAGYFKGNWRQGKQKKADVKDENDDNTPGASGLPPCGPNEISFHINGPDDEVQFNNVITTVGELIKDRRETDPDVKVAYHDMQDKPLPGKPWYFSLKLRSDVRYNVAAPPKLMTVNNVANLIPASSWMPDLLKPVWVVTWGQKGLTPIRPFWHLIKPISLQPGKAVVLTSPKKS